MMMVFDSVSVPIWWFMVLIMGSVVEDLWFWLMFDGCCGCDCDRPPFTDFFLFLIWTGFAFFIPLILTLEALCSEKAWARCPW
ncbi:hypothetical protein A2U01_0057991, partial [Trifolium medium]|nr:hypothetical protein [Trifolium medium]